MSTIAGAVKSGPQGRPAGTAAQRWPLTAPVSRHCTMTAAPPHRGGAPVAFGNHVTQHRGEGMSRFVVHNRDPARGIDLCPRG